MRRSALSNAAARTAPTQQAPMRRAAVRLVLAVVLAWPAGCSSGTTGDEARPSGTAVATTGGEISATAAVDGVEAFLGIPYAAPPVGDLRWRAPQPAQPWTGVRDGGQAGPPCLQGSPDDGGLGAASSEDCLYLNVFRPVPGSSAAAGSTVGTGNTAGPGSTAGATGGQDGLPVMVWVHGGGFIGGSALDVDAAGLVAGSSSAGSPVVVVSLNYRLSALGYLALPELNAGSGGDAGTYATQDITAALRWVRENAAAFGGNPGNVTIFGESAGSMNVCALLASPPAFGLFHRTVAQSGPCTWPFPSMATAEQTGVEMAGRLGCTNPADAVACLRSRPPRDVIEAAGGQENILSYHPWTPAVGGPTLPRPLPEAVRAGEWANVPVVVGTVRDEGRGFTSQWQGQGPIDDPRYAEIVQRYFGDRADAVLGAYPPGSAPPRELLAQVITDAVFTCATDRSASLFAATGVPTYSYEFDVPDQQPITDGVLPGATHSWELRYLFPSASSGDLTTDARRELSRKVIGYWTRFATTGDPNEPPAGAQLWRAWSDAPENAASRKLMLTPEEITPVVDAGVAHHCDVWR